MTIPVPDGMVTIPDLVADLGAIGVKPGMTLIVHSSLKQVGWVCGGAVSVVLALEEVLTPSGTLVMPTHTGDLSDPRHWRNPPVPESWWEPIRQHAPAFDRDFTPCYGMGVIPETFRKQRGVLRSDHAHVSFAAWGKNASFITENHALISQFGEQSPLARIYDLDGWVLLLGVGHDHDTSLHLAEFRAAIARKLVDDGSPMMVDGARQWVPWTDIDWNDQDFVSLGAAFSQATGLQREGKIGAAASLLAPQRALVDFGVDWLEKNRAKG